MFITSAFISIQTHFSPISPSQTQLGRNQPQFCLFKARIEFPSAAIQHQNIKGKTNKFVINPGDNKESKVQESCSHCSSHTLNEIPSSKFTISISDSKFYWWADLAFRSKGKSRIKFNRMREEFISFKKLQSTNSE